MAQPTTIDARITRFSYAVTALLLATAYVFDWQWMVPLLAIIEVLAVVGGMERSVFARIYQNVVIPNTAGTPDIQDAAPQRIAMIVQTVLLVIAAIFLLAKSSFIGWAIALLVTLLGAVAAIAKLCVVCELVEWAQRHSPRR